MEVLSQSVTVGASLSRARDGVGRICSSYRINYTFLLFGTTKSSVARENRLTLHKTIGFLGSIGVRRRFRARLRSLRAPWMTERIGPASRRCGNALGRFEPLERFVLIVEQPNHAPDPLRSGLVPLNRALEGQVGQSISPINIGRWSHGPHLPAGLTYRRAVISKAIDVPESHTSVST